jgi:hypothetical protein
MSKRRYLGYLTLMLAVLASAMTASSQTRSIRRSAKQVEPPAAEQLASSITVTPSPLDFGQITVGLSWSSSVMIMNVSGGTITLNTPFTLTGANSSEFLVSAPGTTVLAAGGSTTASVTFAPNTGGPKSATLNVSATDGSVAMATLQGSAFVPGSSSVVISQVYGGAGCGTANCSAYKNDYIELYNEGTVAQNVQGWSVQYASATGSIWQTTVMPNVTIQPGQYFLIAEGAGANGTLSLPTPDATGTIAMSATAAKVALVSSTAPLSGACPLSSAIVDLVGYGTTTTCNEGGSNAPAPSTANADIRQGIDTNNNGTDFVAAAANPHNSLTPTAEFASVSGRVTTSAGDGVVGASVTVSGGFLTTPTSVRTSATGDYRVDGLEVGATYIVTVRAKNRQITNPSRAVSVLEDVTGVDFVVQP